jgi:hypothetical protein
MRHSILAYNVNKQGRVFVPDPVPANVNLAAQAAQTARSTTASNNNPPPQSTAAPTAAVLHEVWRSRGLGIRLLNLVSQRDVCDFRHSEHGHKTLSSRRVSHP